MYRFLFAVAAAATALVGCVREPEMLPTAEESPILFAAESIETRTAFDDPTGNSYPTLWTENDTKVKIMLNMKTSKDAEVTPAADGKSATFTATFRDTTTYTFFAVSPASAYLNCAETVKVNDEEQVVYRLGVTVPTSQTPTEKSVDEAAQILVAQSATTTDRPEKVSFQFKHWTAYGKLTLSNLTLGDAKIEAVDLTSEVPWANRWYYFFKDGSSTANTASETITVNTTSASDIWFACAPVDLSGKKLTVTVKTDKGTLTKEVTMPANREFKSGQVARFTVNMSGITIKDPEVYELVTKTEDLLVNSKVIIAAASADFAISTTQNGNNRAACAITKDGNTIVDPTSSVEIFTVEAGSEAGSFAFKTGDDLYIYAAGSTKNNYLKSKNTKDATASWNITFGEKTVMKALISDEGARNILQYNPNSGNPIFSCYGGNSTSRDSVAIFKLVGSGGDEPPVEKKDPGLRIKDLKLTVNVGESKEIEITAIDEAYDGTVTFTCDDTSVATVDEDGMVFGVKAGTCAVTVTAPETDKYKEATKTCNITVVDPSAALTIAELLALAEGKLDTGTNTTIEESVSMGQAMVMAVNGTNIVAKDATGLILVYKNSPNVEAGDVITAVGSLKNYYGIAEVAATDITKVSSGATPDHGTPVTFDEAAITAFLAAPVVQYCKISGTLPSNATDYMAVGSKSVALYDKAMYASDYGKMADVYGYSIGRGSKGQVNFINISIEVNANAPFLTVDATSKTWAADAVDAFTVNVSVQDGGSWSYTPTGMDWATLTKSGNTLVVTPKAANTSTTPNEGSVVFKNDQDATKTATVTFKQNAAATGSGYVKYAGTIVEGDYIIFYDGKAMNTTIDKNRLQYVEVTPNGDMIAESDAVPAIVWHIAKSGDSWTLYNASANKYAGGNKTKNQAALYDSAVENALWTISGSETYEIVNNANKAGNVNANLRNNGTYGFACYSTSTGGALTLYKKN
ncbi:MAG: Ig-like domain-containing protein [Bacteroidales bacterium]|nr:Ig-like domain-containing protein [Bacteroidales bacterium]